MMTVETIHACALVAEDLGILVRGKSGSGKTSLMFGLVERLSRAGVSASIVSDDYTELRACRRKLICSAPMQTRGKAEVRGIGIVKVDSTRTAIAGLIVELVPHENIERMPEMQSALIMGLELPLVKVPQRHEDAACRIVICWLKSNTNLALPFPCP